MKKILAAIANTIAGVYRYFKNRKKLFIGVISILILGIFMLIIFAYRSINKPKTPVNVSLNSTTQDLKNRNFDTAIQKLQSSEGQSTNDTDNYALYLRLGTASDGKGEYKAALTYYQKAETYDNTINSDSRANLYLSIANAAAHTGDKKLAITYFNKVIGIYQIQVKQQPYLQSQIEYLQSKVKNLGGT